MKKRFFTLIFLLAVVLILIFSMTACNSSDCSSAQSSDEMPGSESEPAGESTPDSNPCYYYHQAWGEWVTDREATCTETGVKVSVCLGCGYERTQKIRILGHDYNDDYECIRCDHTASKGLEFSVGSKSCSVIGRGTCTDTEIVIPSKRSDGVPVTRVYGFNNCNDITSVVIPYTVGDISGFNNCASLSNVDFSGGTIGWYAFQNCDSLTSLDLSGVSKIGKYAFSGCSGLKEIFIPESVTEIEALAFSGCENLEIIEASEDNKVYSSVNNCLIKTEKRSLVLGCKTSVIPSKYVGEIGERAFYGCVGLTSIVIPSNVNVIDKEAFANCVDLTSVEFPDFVQVAIINSGAFSGCVNLERVTAHEYTITQVGDYAFLDCIKLADINITWTFEVGAYAFYNCKSLKSITVCEVASRIGEYAFGGCDGLESVVFEVTDGWLRAGEAVDLSDPSRNAEELRAIYSSYELTRPS